MLEISFSQNMLAAVLAGRKTVTRRRLSSATLVQQASAHYQFLKMVDSGAVFKDLRSPQQELLVVCPFGWVGAVLHVREAPATRLQVTGIRVERVRSITENEAIWEGIRCRSHSHLSWGGVEPTTRTADGFHWYCSASSAFQGLLNSIYPMAWARNEWVWVLEFALLTQVPIHATAVQ